MINARNAEEKSELLHRVFDKYKDHFSHGFHTVLWHIIMSGNMGSELCCFHVDRKDGCWALIIVTANTPGFIPTPTCLMDDSASHKTAVDFVYEINQDLFGLPYDISNNIVTSSMAAKPVEADGEA